MTFGDLPTASDARVRTADNRLKLIKSAIYYGVNHGRKSASLGFRATPEEEAGLIALGYTTERSTSGETNIYWL
jgi:hypothetical protein